MGVFERLRRMWDQPLGLRRLSNRICNVYNAEIERMLGLASLADVTDTHDRCLFRPRTGAAGGFVRSVPTSRHGRNKRPWMVAISSVTTMALR